MAILRAFVNFLGKLWKGDQQSKVVPWWPTQRLGGSSWVTYWITCKLKINIEPLNAPLEKLNASTNHQFWGYHVEKINASTNNQFWGFHIDYHIPCKFTEVMKYDTNPTCYAPNTRNVCISFHVYSLFPNHLPWSFPLRFPNPRLYWGISPGTDASWRSFRRTLQQASGSKRKKWKTNLMIF